MTKDGRILIVEDNEHSRDLAVEVLEEEGYAVSQAESGEECLTLMETFQPDVILLDRGLPGISGDRVLKNIKTDPNQNTTKVIFVTARANIAERIDGLAMGADDYLTKPFDLNELTARVETQLRTKAAEDALGRAYGEVEQKVRNRTKEVSRANERLKEEILERKKVEKALRDALGKVESLKRQLEEENDYLQAEIKSTHNYENIIGTSPALHDSLQMISKVAATETTVLLMGESGTGKELFARAVHNFSARRERPLVKVNCATLPENIIESELFGHEKGAFTGAGEKRIGRFELADKGTVFLDEIGELPLNLQAKLLRILQEGEFERLGSSTTIRVDTRVIAATNRNLSEAISAGLFREDLYYRLSVFPVVIPPLREREGDVQLLAKHFIDKNNAKLGASTKEIPPSVMETLSNYHWPGNVRELENVIERAVILSQGPMLEVQMEISPGIHPASRTPGNLAGIKEQERQLILSTLERCNWIIGGDKGAAKALNLAPSTLRERIQKFEIQKPS